MTGRGATVTIRSLRPTVTGEEAVCAFVQGVGGAARRVALGPLRSIGEIYVPLRLYRVTVKQGATKETSLVGLDAVNGALDLYRFDRPPDAREIVDVSTHNQVEATLEQPAALDIVLTRVRRMVFRRAGFFAVRPGAVEVEPVPGELYLPYWVGFFGSGETAQIAVMNAVRRRIEGTKVRRVIYRWLSGGSEAGRTDLSPH